MIDWQNGVTPINETNMNKLVESELGTGTRSRYIKYKDGTMIIYGYEDFSFGFTQQEAWANGYTSGQLALPNFPVAFIGQPQMSGAVIKAAGQWGGWWSGVFVGTSATNPGTIEFCRGTASPENSVSYRFTYTAIGRWK